MIHTLYNPTVNLLCRKCRKQTAQLAIGFSNDPQFVLTLIYECQTCGEHKKVFDLNTLPELRTITPNEDESDEPLEHTYGQTISVERGPQIGS
jgi:hypothetical protein